MIVYSTQAHRWWLAMDAHLRRASLSLALQGGNVTPDKAKGHQLDADGLSAPTTSLTGAGVENKYSR